MNPGVEGMIERYEFAFRMQAELPKLLDLWLKRASVPWPAGCRTGAVSTEV